MAAPIVGAGVAAPPATASQAEAEPDPSPPADGLGGAVEFGVTTHLDMFTSPAYLARQQKAEELRGLEERHPIDIR